MRVKSVLRDASDDQRYSLSIITSRTHSSMLAVL